MAINRIYAKIKSREAIVRFLEAHLREQKAQLASLKELFAQDTEEQATE